MTEPTNRRDQYDYGLAQPRLTGDQPHPIEVPGKHRFNDPELDAARSGPDTAALISTNEVEAALSDGPAGGPESAAEGFEIADQDAELAGAGAVPVGDRDGVRNSAQLPDFDRPAARRLVNSDADPLTAEDAREFVDHAYREHLRTQAAFALVLCGPAALFFTMWWPFGMPGSVSFVERSPVLAITIGLVAALGLIAAGLITHFRDGKRPHILRRLEQGTMVPSEESRAFAQRHGAEHAGRARLLLIAGAVLALLGLAVLIWGALQAAGGSIPSLFLSFAICCLLGTAAFLCFYSVFALKRARRMLSA